MATNDEELKPLDLENQRAEQEQEVLKRAAQTDKVVRGVNGGVVPTARKLRPLAGIIVIAIVVLAALYMRHGMANRNKKTTKQAETAKVGVGPATTVEKGLLSDQARNGLDTGQMHVPDSLTPRSSITDAAGTDQETRSGTANGTQASSVPPIEYRQGPVSTAANGSLSFAEQMTAGRVQTGEGGDGGGNLGKGQSAEPGKLKDQCNSPLTLFRQYKPPSSMRGPHKALEAACNLPAFRLEDWGHRSSEQNTNVRTIRSKKGDFRTAAQQGRVGIPRPREKGRPRQV